MPSIDDDIRLELRRMAAEIAYFPFLVGRCEYRPRRDGNDFNGYFTVHPQSFGAWVYYDILAEGAEGTRREVLLCLNDLVRGEDPQHDDIELASKTVAFYRKHEPERVSPPLIEHDTANLYPAEPRYSREHKRFLFEAGEDGLWVARGLKTHERKPYGSRGVESMVKRARAAWRKALYARQDDTLEWLSEQKKLQELADALRSPIQSIRNRLTQDGKTRLIELE